MTTVAPQPTGPDSLRTTSTLFTMDHQPSSEQLDQQQPLKHSPTMPSSPSSPPPPLPLRSARRSSRFLDALLLDGARAATHQRRRSLSLELAFDASKKTSETSTSPSPSPPPCVVDATAMTLPKTADVAPAPAPTPALHDVYLSSEEDASSMGDLSDFDCDDDLLSDTDSIVEVALASPVELVDAAVIADRRPASARSVREPSCDEQPVRRHSHEDTARVVAVVFAGKPSLVDLAAERAARLRSCHSRADSPKHSRAVSPTPSATSAVSEPVTRPSTAGGCLISSVPSNTSTNASTSTTSSAYRRQHQRSSSGSMLMALRARKMETAEAVAVTAASAVGATEPAAAAAKRSFTTPVSVSPLVLAPATAPASATPSPRTPTFLRGVTRSLTLGRRLSRAQPRPRPATSTAAEEPMPEMPQMPMSAVSTEEHRKSLALSVISSLTAMQAPPPALPSPSDDDEDNYNQQHYTYSNVNGKRPATATGPGDFSMRRASTVSPMPPMPSAPLRPPSSAVVSKKGGGSASGFFRRRRSVKLL